MAKSDSGSVVNASDYDERFNSDRRERDIPGQENKNDGKAQLREPKEGNKVIAAKYTADDQTELSGTERLVQLFQNMNANNMVQMQAMEGRLAGEIKELKAEVEEGVKIQKVAQEQNKSLQTKVETLQLNQKSMVEEYEKRIRNLEDEIERYKSHTQKMAGEKEALAMAKDESDKAVKEYKMLLEFKEAELRRTREELQNLRARMARNRQVVHQKQLPFLFQPKTHR